MWPSGSQSSGSPSSLSTSLVPSVMLKKSVSWRALEKSHRHTDIGSSDDCHSLCSLVILSQVDRHSHLLDRRYRLCLWRWSRGIPIRQLRRWTILAEPGRVRVRFQGYLPSLRHRCLFVRRYRARRSRRFRDSQPPKDHAQRRQADFLAVSPVSVHVRTP